MVACYATNKILLGCSREKRERERERERERKREREREREREKERERDALIKSILVFKNYQHDSRTVFLCYVNDAKI